jgi:hypothetical protein
MLLMRGEGRREFNEKYDETYLNCSNTTCIDCHATGKSVIVRDSTDRDRAICGKI